MAKQEVALRPIGQPRKIDLAEEMELAGVVVPLVGKAHGDAGTVVDPELLDQAVVDLAGPLALQEGLDRFTSHRELGAIAPHAVPGVGLGHPLRVAAVPGVFGHAHLLHRRLAGEGRQGRAGFVGVDHRFLNKSGAVTGANGRLGAGTVGGGRTPLWPATHPV